MSDTPRTRTAWNRDRPRVLVVACSDGRLQENLDAFLLYELGITHYDRLYAPGGGGALASSGFTHTRADFYRRECAFLIEAHRIERLLLIFHGPSEDGPDDATCADYRRRFIASSSAEIRRQQHRDADALRTLSWGATLQVQCFYCQITADDEVQFVPL